MRRACTQLILAFLIAFFLMSTSGPATAQAAPKCGDSRKLGATYDTLKLSARCGDRGQDKPSKTGGSASDRHVPTAQEIYEAKLAAWKKQVATIMAANAKLAAAYSRCVDNPTHADCASYAGRKVLPNSPKAPKGGKIEVLPPPPEVVAYQAVAKLTLTPPKPLIGPPPEINRWKTAVVGYPYWLSTGGNPNPPTVTTTAYDITVSLTARLDHVTFDMGDGHRVTCSDTTHPWTRSVATSKESPWCGYTYQHVPPHAKTYTVFAHSTWTVAWRVNGTTGSLPFYQQASVQLPVSELQVLVR